MVSIIRDEQKTDKMEYSSKGKKQRLSFLAIGSELVLSCVRVASELRPS